MRHHGGGPSMGNFIGRMIVSEFLNAAYRPKWRVGNNISQCILCGKCEAVCHRNALKVNSIAKTWTLNNRRCDKCMGCIMACPTKCLTQVSL